MGQINIKNNLIPTGAELGKKVNKRHAHYSINAEKPAK